MTTIISQTDDKSSWPKHQVKRIGQTGDMPHPRFAKVVPRFVGDGLGIGHEEEILAPVPEAQERLVGPRGVVRITIPDIDREGHAIGPRHHPGDQLFAFGVAIFVVSIGHLRITAC